MLKIYRKTIKHKIHSNGSEYDIHHESFYTIEDEAVAESYIKEHDLYSDAISNVVSYCSCYESKRGRTVYAYGNIGELKFKQWKEPNAKLIECVTYKECSCSMNTLFNLPVDKVISYLKQEGMNLILSS